MRMYGAVLIVSFLMLFGLDYYVFFHIKKWLKNPFLKVVYWCIPSLLAIFLLLVAFGGEALRDNHQYMAQFIWFVFVFLLLYIPKTIYFIFDLLNSLLRFILRNKTKCLRYVGITLGSLFFISMIYGTVITRFDFEVNTVEIKAENLPEEFDGFKIVQISDIHLGNWNKNFDALEKMVELIMQQKPDMIVVTGDLVNNFSDEATGFEPIFNKLKAPYGKYGIMGNHDYGDYSSWNTPEDKTNNLIGVHNAYKNLGFTLLLDSTVIIQKENAEIGLIGMENWGHPPFPRYGNLQQAKKGSEKTNFNILLSHDPNHWCAEIVHKENITLTLAGHTHGMQMGIDKWGLKFSPSQWVFKQWKGLYTCNKQYIYVNQGIGYVGMPTRIGIRPEITVIILKK